MSHLCWPYTEQRLASPMKPCPNCRVGSKINNCGCFKSHHFGFSSLSPVNAEGSTRRGLCLQGGSLYPHTSLLPPLHHHGWHTFKSTPDYLAKPRFALTPLSLLFPIFPRVAVMTQHFFSDVLILFTVLLTLSECRHSSAPCCSSRAAVLACLRLGLAVHRSSSVFPAFLLRSQDCSQLSTKNT